MNGINHTKENLRIRGISGGITSNDPLVDFLYDLMRDLIVPGTIEKLMRDAVQKRGKPRIYSNGYLAQYAQYIASRLKGL